jgi:hypothetical protein
MNIYNNTIPYIYKWIHIPTGKWYIGSKIRKGWNPNRHEEYICSSKQVKLLILENRGDWKYEILYTGDPDFIKNLEKVILTELDAKNDPMSFNQHNGDGLYSRYGVKENEQTRQRKKEARLGIKNPMYGKTGILSPHYGKKHSDATNKKRSDSLKNYSQNRPNFHNENISKSLKGNLKLIERMTGSNNPMYGIPASDYNKAMTKLKNSGDNNPMKKPEHQKKCLYCGQIVAKNHFTMFHGNKCKKFETSNF